MKQRIIFVDGTERVVDAETPTAAIVEATRAFPELAKQIRTVITMQEDQTVVGS